MLIFNRNKYLGEVIDMVKTILFDLDGTLLDTLEDLTNSINYMLEKLGLEQKTVPMVQSYVGNGIAKMIERALPTDISKTDFDKAIVYFKEHYSLHSEDNTKEYQGITQMLKAVKNTGYKSGIVSNKFDAGVQVLAKQFFDNLIDFSIGDKPPLQPKPSSDLVEVAINELNADKATTIFVGDSDVDYHTAKNSNLPFVAVSWGFKGRKYFEDLSHNYIIDKPQELLDLVKTM